MRLELAALNLQILMHNGQLFNGAPLCLYYRNNYLIIIVLLITNNIKIYYSYVKHITYLIRANLMGTIACYKKDMIGVFWAKDCMTRLTNSFKVFFWVSIPSYHSGIEYSAVKLYVEVWWLWLMRLINTSSIKKDGGSKQSINGNIRTKGSTEKGNFGVDRGLVVLNIHRKMNFNILGNTLLNTLIRKGTRGFSTKELNTSDLKELVELAKLSENKDIKLNNLLKLCKDPDLLKLVYNKIKSNLSNMIEGTSRQTLDGISNNWFDFISNEIGSGRLKINLSRSIEILKLKGGTRQLSFGNLRDKIIQESIKIILTIIFELLMSNNSHGFRLNKSCHTAIWQIRNNFNSVNWFIKIDILKCFDSILHNLIISQLKKRIDDQGFINLISKVLKAGYYDSKGVYHNLNYGILQGATISLILSNIVLSLIDDWLDEYIDKFNCGTVRKIDLKYSKLSQLIRRAKLFSERIKLSKLRAKTTNLHLKNDLDFKRLKYVRYGDDILLGVIGSKQDCIIIQDSLSKFIETLNLNINKDKTFIKCASKKLARFLGYDIKITLRHKYLIVNKHYSIRTIRGLNNTRLIINALIRYILNNLVDHGYARSCKNGRFAQLTGLGRLMHEEIHVIINHYLMVGRGILSYYRLATNYNKLKHRIWYTLYYSCVLTLAKKLRILTKSKLIKKLGFLLRIKDNKGDIITQFLRNVFDNIVRIDSEYSYKAWINKSNFNELSPILLLLKKLKYWLLASRQTLNNLCIICNSYKNVEMHHIKKLYRLRLFKRYDYITSRMILINRKQVLLCRDCHIKLHKGNITYKGITSKLGLGL